MRIASDQATADCTESPVEFVISEELTQTTEEHVEELFNFLFQAPIKDSTSVPLYPMVSFRLCNSVFPSDLLSPILLYERLERYVDEHKPDTIRVVGSLAETYESVVLDVADAYELEVAELEENSRGRLTSYLQSLYYSKMEILDIALSGLRNASGIDIEQTDTVFFPEASRFDSFQPLLETTDTEGSVFVRDQRHRLEWQTLVQNEYESLREYDPTPLSAVAKPADVLTVSRFFFSELAKEVLVNRAIESQLIALLKKRVNVAMQRTVATSFRRLLPRLFVAGAKYTLAKRLFGETGCEQIVVGRLGDAERAIMTAANELGVQTYYLPHSVVTGYEYIPRSETVHFVPGHPGDRRLSGLPHVPDEYKSVVTGRPRLSRLYEEEFEQPSVNESETLRVLLATQPFDNTVRREFVTEVLKGIEAAEGPIELVIKIHPSEQREFYQDLLQEQNAVVPVHENNLLDQLKRADLVVTIDSNTGIESICVGTPCVSVNLWQPIIRESPYLRDGPIPVLSSSTDIRAFFKSLDAVRLTQLGDEQLQFARGEFNIDGDPVQEILQVLGES